MKHRCSLSTDPFGKKARIVTWRLAMAGIGLLLSIFSTRSELWLHF
jgi:hypothetical protein